MTVQVRHRYWQVLRTILRKGGPILGSELRISMSRQLRGGTFLLDLVEAKLVAPELGKPWPPSGSPFDRTYTLTELGKQAAEFGEFEGPPEAQRLV